MLYISKITIIKYTIKYIIDSLSLIALAKTSNFAHPKNLNLSSTKNTTIFLSVLLRF